MCLWAFCLGSPIPCIFWGPRIMPSDAFVSALYFQGEQPEWVCPGKVLQDLLRTFIFVSALCFQGEQPEWEFPGERHPRAVQDLHICERSIFQSEQSEWECPGERPARAVQDLHICERSIFSGWATWVRVPRRTTSKSFSRPSFVFVSALFFQGEQPEWECPGERPPRAVQDLHICERCMFSGWATWVRVPRRTTSKTAVQDLHICERSMFSGWATWVRVPGRTTSKSKSCSNPSYLWALYIFRVSNLSESAQENDLQEQELFKPFIFVSALFFQGEQPEWECPGERPPRAVQTLRTHCQDLPCQGQDHRTVQGTVIHSYSSAPVLSRKNSSQPVRFHLSPFRTLPSSSQSVKMRPNSTELVPENQSSSEFVNFFLHSSGLRTTRQNTFQHVRARQNSSQPIITLPNPSEHFPTRQKTSQHVKTLPKSPEHFPTRVRTL